MEISSEEYIYRSRPRVVEVASGMLNGSIDYLEGAIELSSLWLAIGLPENDSDFLVFIAIASEIESLPIGVRRQYCSKESLERHEPEIQSAIVWAKKVSLAECMSIVARFTV